MKCKSCTTKILHRGRPSSHTKRKCLCMIQSLGFLQAEVQVRTCSKNAHTSATSTWNHWKGKVTNAVPVNCQSFGRHREARNMHSPWGLPSWVQFCHPATTHAAPEWRQRTPTHADPPRTHHDFFLIQISCFYIYMSQVTTSVKNSRHFQRSPRIRVQSIRRLLKSSLHCLQVLGEMTI